MKPTKLLLHAAVGQAGPTTLLSVYIPRKTLYKLLAGKAIACALMSLDGKTYSIAIGGLTAKQEASLEEGEKESSARNLLRFAAAEAHRIPETMSQQ